MAFVAICIQMTNLTKCYGSVVAVGGLSLGIESGEALCLLGANGAGKTTTLYLLSGLVRPTAGTVSVFGKDIRRHFLDIAPRMGVLVERPAFYDYLTARRNLMLAAQLARKEMTVDRALDRVGLLPLANKKVGTFSLGMRQRLGLAHALLTEPELLVLDEPTSGLDPEGGREVLSLLRALVEEAKVTVIFSSHMLAEVEALADRVAVLNRGRLLACERVDTLLSYDESQVEVLLDAPETAARRLEQQPWVRRVEALPGRIKVMLQESSVHHLTTFLIAQGFVLSGVIPRRWTLQDYLLKVLEA